MNPTLEQIQHHVSIRKYQDKEVEQKKLDLIIDAAARASSSGNMQTYSIIVTKDLELRKKLSAPHFNQSMVTEAPVLMTFCADFSRMKKWLDLREAPQNFDNFMSFMIAGIDATLASANAALAAESLGLGICYMGTTLANCHEIGDILGCPENVVPVVGFSLGYPDEEVPPRDRLPQPAFVHVETYHDYSAEEIEKHYQEKESAGMARYQSVPDLKQMMDEKSLKNLAQVYTAAKYTRESHVEYSKNVLRYLERQNFMRNQ